MQESRSMTQRSTGADSPAEARADQRLRNAALATSASVLALQQRAEQELLHAKAALEERTEQLTRSFSLLSATLGSMPFGIVALDLSGNVVSYNSRYVAMWGVPRELLESGDSAAIVRHIARQVKDPEAYLQRVADRRSEPEAEVFDVVELADGRTFERHVFPQRVDRVCTGVVVSWRDVTERNLLEAQLRQAQKMEAIGTLAAGIAHDFNNLLSVVLGTADLVDASLPPDAPQHEDLAQIRIAGERAATLTRQLLTFARPLPADARAVHLGRVVLQLEKLLRRLIDAKIEIVTVVPADLWSIRADPAQMDQVVLNLAINARDAMSDGGRLMVSVANEAISATRAATLGMPPGDYVTLSVSDTGQGMTAEVLEHAFEPFYTTKHAAGSGLGLATVYGIVQRHGGRILTETAPGSGATFTILFPKTMDAEERSPLADPATVRAGGHTILLVEDDPLVRTLSNRMLSGLGYRVIETAIPADAIAIAGDRMQHLDLLLTDVTMPLMSGPEVAARVRSARSRLPVVLMSGYTEQAVGELVGQRDGYHFIAKPFTAAQLGAQVRAALEAGVRGDGDAG
jgi:PAS domain S-box-containing protein